MPYFWLVQYCARPGPLVFYYLNLNECCGWCDSDGPEPAYKHHSLFPIRSCRTSQHWWLLMQVDRLLSIHNYLILQSLCLSGHTCRKTEVFFNCNHQCDWFIFHLQPHLSSKRFKLGLVLLWRGICSLHCRSHGFGFNQVRSSTSSQLKLQSCQNWR